MNVDVNGYTEDNIQNIDLAYAYTEDYLKHCVTEASKISSRLGTFLGFAGLLLRFDMELSHSQPIYLLTKIIALLTSFCAIAIISWRLKAYMIEGVIAPTSFLNFELSKSVNTDIQFVDTDIKFVIFKKHSQTCEELYFSSLKQIEWLNRAINCLMLSAFFFTVNCILVSSFGE